MAWTILGFCAATLTMFGFLPQTIKIYRTKSVKDISLIAILQFLLGIFLWILYGVHLRDLVIILANSVSFVILLVKLFLYLKYR